MGVDYCRCAEPIEHQGECARCGGFIYVTTAGGRVRPELVDGVPIAGRDENPHCECVRAILEEESADRAFRDEVFDTLGFQ